MAPSLRIRIKPRLPTKYRRDCMCCSANNYVRDAKRIAMRGAFAEAAIPEGVEHHRELIAHTAAGESFICWYGDEYDFAYFDCGDDCAMCTGDSEHWTNRLPDGVTFTPAEARHGR